MPVVDKEILIEAPKEEIFRFVMGPFLGESIG